METSRTNCGGQLRTGAGRAGAAVLTLAAALLVLAAPLAAHEFWLEANDFSPDTGDHIAITNFVGHDFNGESFPYQRLFIQSYVVVDSAGKRDAEGVDGNDPGLKLEVKEEGLTILAYLSLPNAITFQTWSEFDDYLKGEGLERIEALHRKRGLPKTGINEFYTRCAKALIGVGGGKGEDRPVGLPLELVAEANPYALKSGESLPVRLLYDGKPAAGVMIKVLSKAHPKQPQKLRTDAEGRVVIPLPDAGPYLLNAVHMLEPSGLPETGQTYHWMSYWTSLTFERP